MISKLKKLNKREQMLALASSVLIITLGYVYGMLKPAYRALTDLNVTHSQLKTQKSELSERLSNLQELQQQRALIAQQTQLNNEINALKKNERLSDYPSITNALSKSGVVESYTTKEITRDGGKSKIEINIVHNSKYTMFKNNLQNISRNEPAMQLNSIQVNNNKYTSEWTAWIKN